jgi:Protein of unknown function (DUF3575)
MINKGLLFMMLISLSNYAQDSLGVSNHLLKLNILRTGLAYEKSITKSSTLNLDANFTPFFKKGNSVFGAPKFFLNVNGHYRYYYNFEKRKKKGKNISGNSGNYLALGSSYYFKSLDEAKDVSFNDGFSTSLVWGLQRTYKNKLYINLNAGLGYNFSVPVRNVKPVINFTLGYILFENSSKK